MAADMYGRQSRYIPTPVGRLGCPGHDGRAATVHPHACGEIEYDPDTHQLSFGTSPRLWGDCPKSACVRGFGRYIPTPVGRFPCCKKESAACAVHPHACGEIWDWSLCAQTSIGTSPRLWGDCLTPFYSPYTPRYIPTPVGRFPFRLPYAVLLAVHPHACGEIHQTNRSSYSPSGTSPRLWGD